jgi:hypothetical protein
MIGWLEIALGVIDAFARDGDGDATMGGRVNGRRLSNAA